VDDLGLPRVAHALPDMRLVEVHEVGVRLQVVDGAQTLVQGQVFLDLVEEVVAAGACVRLL